ncbi:hypothetical protein D3C80_1638530 [compost metagenome]
MERWAGQIQAQALSVKVRPVSISVRLSRSSRAASSSSGKHLLRLIRATSRERFGSFHIIQPIAAPVFCTARQGSRANRRNAPTTSAPLSFSTESPPD